MTSPFISWSSAPPSWLESPVNNMYGIVISSRVRIARNFEEYPFPHHASSAVQKKILTQTIAAFKASSKFETGHAFVLEDLGALQRTFLSERHLISPQHANQKGHRGLIVSPGETISIMINEEDHIRAAAFGSGLALSQAAEELSGLDDTLITSGVLAYSRDVGYITACPTNLGTGLRASCLLHLPVLCLTGRISEVLKDLNRLGLTARGFYGEGTNALGDLFQISNTRTLGVQENVLVKEVEKVVARLCELEFNQRELLARDAKAVLLEDRLYRSLGTLKFARVLSFEEAMKHLSMIRLGYLLRFDLPHDEDFFSHLMFSAQPAHVLLRQNDPDGKKEDVLRAELMREKIK